VKVFSQTPVNPDRLPKWIRVRPDLVEAEAERIKQLPEISYAAIWAQNNGRLSYSAQRTQNVLIMGADDRYQEIQGGELLDGRWFTQAELSAGTNVVVLDEKAAHKLFGRESVLDKEIRISGRPARVIGLYAQPDNIFSPPGQDIGAIIPYAMMDHQFTIDKTNALYIPVKPKKGVTTADAEEAVTIALREMRKLRPADKNNFDLITQDQILDTFNKITGVFFLVMIVLSSVGLLVGGIGVMAIMMVSVTSRTREIGIRKALGATRKEILFQFLVEAATLTGFGGLLGILIGLTFGRLATLAMRIDAGVPLGLTAVAVLVSVSIGLVFGMLPAQRAARLDPIAALRYE
jgi:putative ABC transport system permease protein